MKKFIFTIISAIVLSTNLFAQDGTLDLSFDLDGRIMRSFGGSWYGSSSWAAITASDKIISTSHTATGGTYYTSVFNFFANGARNTGFGTAGKVTISDFKSSGIAYSPQNKIFIFGVTDDVNAPAPKATIHCLDSTGNIVSSFGVNGKLIVDYTVGSFIMDFEITSAGDIICMIENYNERYLVKILSTGAIDQNFGTNGKYFIDLYPFYYNPSDLEIDYNNRIFFYQSKVTYDSAQIKCLLPSGALDQSFGVNGEIIPEFNTDYFITNYKILGNKIFTISTRDTSSIVRFREYNLNGVLNLSFGTNGIKDNFWNRSFDISGIISQPDGKILLGGSLNGPSSITSNFCLVRIKQNGEIDSTMGTFGYVTTSFSQYSDRGTSLLMQSNNKPILAGYTKGNNYVNGLQEYFFSAARYNITFLSGIEDITDDNLLSIYPNPSKGIFTISQNNTIKSEIEVFNTIGELYYKTTTISSKTTIDLSELPKGIYLVRATDTNKVSITKKIIIN